MRGEGKMEEKERHFCSVCHDRIFRYGYKINGELYCNTCMNRTFLVLFDRKEYLLSEKDNNKGGEAE